MFLGQETIPSFFLFENFMLALSQVLHVLAALLYTHTHTHSVKHLTEPGNAPYEQLFIDYNASQTWFTFNSFTANLKCISVDLLFF